MKVIVEMSLEQVKKYLHDYADAYVGDGERVGILVFHEGEYRHKEDCECHTQDKSNGICSNMEYRPKRGATALKVLEIKP